MCPRSYSVSVRACLSFSRHRPTRLGPTALGSGAGGEAVDSLSDRNMLTPSRTARHQPQNHHPARSDDLLAHPLLLQTPAVFAPIRRAPVAPPEPPLLDLRPDPADDDPAGARGAWGLAFVVQPGVSAWHRGGDAILTAARDCVATTARGRTTYDRYGHFILTHWHDDACKMDSFWFIVFYNIMCMMQSDIVTAQGPGSPLVQSPGLARQISESRCALPALHSTSEQRTLDRMTRQTPNPSTLVGAPSTTL